MESFAAMPKTNTFKPGQLYSFRKNVVVHAAVYLLAEDGFSSSKEIDIPFNCVALYLYKYVGQFVHSANGWGVFLFGEQIGVAMTKYFISVPRPKRVKT